MAIYLNTFLKMISRIEHTKVPKNKGELNMGYSPHQIAVEYLLRKDRIAHPSGKTDKGNRWYPNEDELSSCCKQVRPPSRSFPWSFMTHCRSLKHLCNLHNTPEKEVRFLLTKKGLPLLIGMDNHVDKLIEKKMKE